MNTTNTAPRSIIELRLGAIMQERKLSVREVAIMTTLTEAAVYRMIRSVPDRIALTSIEKICTALEITPGDLFLIRHPKLAARS